MAKARKRDRAEDAPSKRKAKKRSARAKSATTDTAQAGAEDSMSQGVALCQEQRWREAVLLFRKVRNKAVRSGNTELAGTLKTALLKVEFSLRRQMGATLIKGARELLAKEYLLDVGQ